MHVIFRGESMISTILSYLTDVGKLYILIYGIFNVKLRLKCHYIAITIMVSIGILVLCYLVGV